MNKIKMTKEDLELMSHTDIAYNILKQEKKTFTTIDLLKNICKLLDYSDAEYENIIGEFYTSLNMDKRFILIDGKWDLAENHVVKIIIDDEGDDEDIENYDDEDNEEPSEIEDEAVLDDTEMLEDIDDALDDDMDDLTILTEDEIEEEDL